ncbi:polysaccharide lyase family 8 super-sandwich domain-containing protein [Enterococcus sp. LJL99]
MIRKKRNLYLTIVLSIVFLVVGGKVQAADDSFELTFEDGKTGNWKDIVGTTDLSVSSKQLVASNTTTGSTIESVAIATDSPVMKDGEVLLDFLYEGQKNFSLIFRADDTKSSNWQTFAYNSEGKWTLGEPGGKWISEIAGPTLEAGERYQLLIRYSGVSIKAYLNGEVFYENEVVTYPNNKGTISNDWQGKTGVRFFGNRSTLKINALKSGPVGAFSNEPEPENEESLALMRDRWRTNAVGDFERSPELLDDPDVKKYIDSLSANAESLYEQMDQSEGRTYLWAKVASDTKSADLTTQFKKLNTLAKAYGTKGTSLYKKPEVAEAILSGLEFMTETGRYAGGKYYGNWWDWQVGVPQEFITTLFIMHEEIPKQQLQKYTNILSSYLPNPSQQLYGKSQDTIVELHFIPNFANSGANRTDQALSCLGIGILANDSGKITQAVASIKEVFEIVSSGDGFYEDGSFIQHYDIPYNGSYGNVLVKGVGKIFSIVADTPWQLETELIDQFVTNVENAFIPLVVNGETMPMVNGRSISRAPAGTKEGFGSTTLYNLLITSEFANETSKARLQETAKYWMVQNPNYYYKHTRDFKDLLITKELMANDAVNSQTRPFTGSHVYGAMDRFVYGDTSNIVGISMYSTRISAFEAINKENKKGWHTSDGMVYLYNSDQQFGDSYWPTVDFYRLPGTTVDTVALKNEDQFTSYRSKEAHVGGVTDGEDATVAMNLNKKGTLNNSQATTMDLEAKKSWFILDGKIVQLGAGINGTTNASIETVVENRLLDETSQYEFKNQAGKLSENRTNQTVKANDWLLLDSTKENQSIGYLMLEDQTITTQKETRTGTYKEINDAFPSDKLYNGTYQKVLIEHGQKVTDGHYAYVTYPDATEQKLNDLVANNQLSVLANTKEVQAVKDNQSGTIGVNIWAANGVTIADISTNKPAALLVKKVGNQYTINVSDPRQSNEVIDVKLPNAVKAVHEKDEAISLKEDGQTIAVNTKNALGKTMSITVELEADETVDVIGVKSKQNSLTMLKKGAKLPLDCSISPENATDPSFEWKVEDASIATIENNQLVAKKAGTTRVTVTTKNGLSDHFVLRVTP